MGLERSDPLLTVLRILEQGLSSSKACRPACSKLGIEVSKRRSSSAARFTSNGLAPAAMTSRAFKHLDLVVDGSS